MTTERERKELNKKLIKTTVKSELKKPKKFDFLKFFVDFLLLFLGMVISDLLAKACGLEGGFLPIFFDICMLIVMLGIAVIVNGKLFPKN